MLDKPLKEVKCNNGGTLSGGNDVVFISPLSKLNSPWIEKISLFMGDFVNTKHLIIFQKFRSKDRRED